MEFFNLHTLLSRKEQIDYQFFKITAMKKGFNIDSTEWCEMVFKDKNKKYGAYALRQTSSKRHMVALGVIFVVMLFVSLLPQVIGAVKELNRGAGLGAMDEEVLISQVEVDLPVPEENIIREELAPPPPPLISSVKFTPPLITADDKVVDGDEMKSMDELNSTDIRISTHDIQSDLTTGVTMDELIEHKVIVGDDTEKEEPPHVSVEVMPQFKGGESEMYAFIGKNLRYPVTAQEQNIQGRVIIRFVVTAAGDISDVQLLRGIDPACDKEAIRVVKMMPKWIPGKQNGRNVPVYFTLPVVYKLQ